MTPYINDSDFRLYVGDALETLRELPDESVDCVVTSPPYWGLRDYSVEGQLGLEPTPDAYVARMVEVFREVRRVLAKHGTCWVNLGDSYNNRNMSRLSSHQGGLGFDSDDLRKSWVELKAEGRTRMSIEDGDLKEKDLVGVPWMVAFALRADGWYLRSDIVWSKPNPMPESVTDRPTKAHEYVFLLTKQPRYWFDQEAVREPHESTRWGGRYHTQNPNGKYTADSDVRIAAASKARVDRPEFDHYPHGGRNIRSVWEIATQPYPEAHFATFPEELARRCILAGCPERVCRVCGKPSERITDVSYVRAPGGTTGRKRDVSEPDGNQRGMIGKPTMNKVSETLGWTDCSCPDPEEAGTSTPGTGSGTRRGSPHSSGKWRPGVVLDPFLGSGTTALVARNHGRHAIGIELSAEYAEFAARRTRQLSLLAT